MMKPCCILTLVTLLLAAAGLLLTGCEFDVAEPKWEEPAPATAAVSISSIDPAAAVAGVNYITIHGANFTGAIDTLIVKSSDKDTSYRYLYNGIYFDDVKADVVEFSDTVIKVRRPKLANEACQVKVVSNKAMATAKYAQPYRIDAVVGRYGLFNEDLPLAVVVVDARENLYVVETNTRYIQKITPSGDKTNIASALRVPYDASIGGDGNLYLAGNNRAIDRVDLSTGTIARWVNLPSGKVVKFLDFSETGYCFAGGTRTDLVVIPGDLSTTAVSAGFYATQEILAIRCYNGAVYVAARATAADPVKIYRHAIGDKGSVGAQELVLDLSKTSMFAGRSLKAISFASDGTMIIATDAADPLLSYTPATGQMDYYYKGILNPYCKHFSWGSKTYLYMICGDDTAGEEWTVYRVDMGTTAGN
ncbi:MAG TPA: hypothetical protein PLN61_12760 [bacterium]|nr:hypothetical protein [bacterium]HQI49519.1 hypothetical protein [bacterium]HQJ64930.1 hypothetical protein [bacterium]